ncbi:LOW QUALITY PROTEIN: histone H4 transcription factor [Anopheles stephensi]|uniref:LOW QUALITY PROTEIN: histone H4 transcription factor n=1 Tax=Anopheles stephensi TaxID=30069 RepID=UPI0016587421|nr:LOW QUALITY PROTEIN: histone H4 transcription factor [Anopheles stephensi]
MDKGKKRRKRQAVVAGAKEVKKRKLAVVEETKDGLVSPEPPLAEPAKTSENGPDISSIRKEINDWMEKQGEYERADMDELLEESNQSSDHEEPVDVERLQNNISVLLRDHSQTTARKSFKFECEWSKCTFMSGDDRKYVLHVESHAETVMGCQTASYACEWDLCGFVTSDDHEYTGHVHYHAYHTKLKVHGASVQMLAKLPSCNNDSRVRNTITNFPVTFRCEWDVCKERFSKALHFFHHVSNHVCDQFPTDRKTVRDGVQCRWSLCSKRFTTRFHALWHSRLHTTERDIACFTCGTKFWKRIHFAHHVIRQLEMSQRTHECSICGKLYATKSMLNAHVDTHNKQHECMLCPLKFTSKCSLSSHMLRMHMKQRNFKCGQCEYAAFSNRELVKHMGTHDRTKLFRCEEFGCNVAYRSEQAIKKHIAWHYNLPPTLFGCHLCTDKTYKNAHHLSKHLRSVHQVERTPGYGKFMYRADSDGVHRLSTYVEQKCNSKTSAPSVDTAADNQESEATEAGKSRKKAKSPKKPAEKTGATDSKKSPPDATAYAPIKGRPKINSFKSIGAHEFLIELNMEPEPAETQSVGLDDVSKMEGKDTATAAKRNSETARVKRKSVEQTVVKFVGLQDESSVEDAASPPSPPPSAQQQPKDVKDFTVMKRYLKLSKKSA